MKKIEVSERFDSMLPKNKEKMVELYYHLASKFKTKTQIMITLGLTNYEFKKFRKVYIDPQEEELYTLHKDIVNIASQYGVTSAQLKERLAGGLGVYTSATFPPDFTVEQIKECE